MHAFMVAKIENRKLGLFTDCGPVRITYLSGENCEKWGGHRESMEEIEQISW